VWVHGENIVIGIADMIPQYRWVTEELPWGFSPLEIRWESDILLNLD
jgi:hypothetical protein